MKRPLLIVLLFICVVTLGAARKALVIGNAEYTDSPLKNTVNDAWAVERLLCDLGFETTIRLNLDKRRFDESIESFASSLQANDEAVFYYSGHGAQIEGENFLIPVGKVLADEADVKYEAISANRATEKISKACLSIVILDACRDNPYKGVRSANKGLAPMSVKAGGQFVIYSTASGQTASDGGSGDLSPFTEAFVRHAAEPNVTIEEMMRNVVRQVKAQSRERQIPFYYGSLENAFCFSVDENFPEERRVHPRQPEAQSLPPVPPAEEVQKAKLPYRAPEIPGMVFVEGGSFLMGCRDGDRDERQEHEVRLDSFYIGRHEITQKEWMEVMGSNPSQRVGNILPVEKISWYDAIEYCNRRSLNEGLTPIYRIDRSKQDSFNTNSLDDLKWVIALDTTANGYRLPTEAEWEYAARGGRKSMSYKFSGANDLSQIAWHFQNSGNKSNPVGSKAANELGLYDMTGNVWEWCWDWYQEDYYENSPRANPQGGEQGEKRSLRGSSWLHSGNGCRSTRRYAIDPHIALPSNGFRVVRTKSQEG